MNRGFEVRIMTRADWPAVQATNPALTLAPVSRARPVSDLRCLVRAVEEPVRLVGKGTR